MIDNKVLLCFSCRKELSEAANIFNYGLHEFCFKKWFGLQEPEEFSSIERRDISSTGPEKNTALHASWNDSFFVGKFKKYSATLAGESYILKVKENEAPELPDVEYLCNQVARSVGVTNPDFYLINFNGTRTFVTKNFIKKGVSVTLDHLYHYLPAGEESYTCEILLSTIAAQTKHPTDAEMFVKTCLFDSLVGNHDRHGRNLGLLRTPRGSSLAPIYDNTSSLGLEQGEILKADWSPRGKIATPTTRKPTPRDYIAEFTRLGHEKTVENFVNHLSIPRLTKIVSDSTCSPLMKEAMTILITARVKEMESELGKKSP